MHDHGGSGSGDRRGADGRPVVVLVGRPNVGKSTFLARASRRFVETANAPGTTVAMERRLVTAGGREAWLVDLPGTRALDDVPAGDAPFSTWLLEAAPDAILIVADAGNLGRHLPLALACRDLGLPVVLAANLVDEAAKRGVTVDAGRLCQLFNAPVHATCARTGEGVDAALADAIRLGAIRRAVRNGEASPRATVPSSPYPMVAEDAMAREAARLRTEPRSLGAAAVLDPLHAGVLAGIVSPRGGASIRLASELEPVRWRVAARWAEQAERHRDVDEPWADRVARWATSPWPGIPAFFTISVAMLLVVIQVGGFLAAALSAAWAATVSPLLAVAVPAIVPFPTSRTPCCGRSTAGSSGCCPSASRTCSRSTCCSRSSRTRAT